MLGRPAVEMLCLREEEVLSPDQRGIVYMVAMRLAMDAPTPQEREVCKSWVRHSCFHPAGRAMVPRQCVVADRGSLETRRFSGGVLLPVCTSTVRHVIGVPDRLGTADREVRL